MTSASIYFTVFSEKILKRARVGGIGDKTHILSFSDSQSRCSSEYSYICLWQTESRTNFRYFMQYKYDNYVLNVNVFISIWFMERPCISCPVCDDWCYYIELCFENSTFFNVAHLIFVFSRHFVTFPVFLNGCSSGRHRFIYIFFSNHFLISTIWSS